MNRNDFKILIAEDEPGVQKLYDKAFRQEGYEVALVSSGEELLAELKEGPFDILVTDMKLEGMSALEVLPEIRRKYPNLPIVVVSGHYVNLMEEFNQKGFDVDLFFNKPLSLMELKKAVRRILGLPVKEDSKDEAAS
jgi:CheY-like chemotaxis protein